MVDVGAEPRRELKFMPAVNAKQSLKIKIDSDLGMTMGGRKIQKSKTQLTVAMDLVVQNIAPNGDITYQATYTDIGLTPDGSMSPDRVKSLAQQAKTVVGTNVITTISATGIIKAQKSMPPQNFDPMMQQTIDTTNRQLENFAIPLPLAKVGIGATWKTARKERVSDIDTISIVNYRLVKLTDKEVWIESKIQQNAGIQPMMDGTVKLNYLETIGTGTTTLKLDRLLPLDGKFDILTKNQVESLSSEESPAPVTVDTDMSMKMELTTSPR
jgi:hypothetical protein